MSRPEAAPYAHLPEERAAGPSSLEERVGERRPITIPTAAVRAGLQEGCGTSVSGVPAETNDLLSPWPSPPEEERGARGLCTPLVSPTPDSQSFEHPSGEPVVVLWFECVVAKLLGLDACSEERPEVGCRDCLAAARQRYVAESIAQFDQI